MSVSSKTARPSLSPSSYRGPISHPPTGYAYGDSDAHVAQLNSYMWPQASPMSGMSPEYAQRYKHPKYRTKPCLNYMRGQCTFGDQCDFVHLDRIQRPASTNGAARLDYRRESSDPSVYVDDHDLDDGLVSPLSLESLPSPGSPPTYRKDSRGSRGSVTVVHVPVFMPAPPVIPMFEQAKLDKMANRTRASSVGNVNPTLFKTRPCKYFNQEGYCPRGEACTFIHDPNLARRASVTTAPKRDSIGTIPENGDTTQPTWRVLGGGVRIGEAHERGPEVPPDYRSGKYSAGDDDYAHSRSRTPAPSRSTKDAEFAHPRSKTPAPSRSTKTIPGPLNVTRDQGSRSYHNDFPSRRSSGPNTNRLGLTSMPMSAPPTKTTYWDSGDEYDSDDHHDYNNSMNPNRAKSTPPTPKKERSGLPTCPAESP